MADVQEIQRPPRDRPEDTAYTLACNDCGRHVFADLEVLATECCADLFCIFCWTKIQVEGRHCKRAGCNGALLNPIAVIWSEDTDSTLSKERDYRRQVLLDRDPRFRALMDALGVLRATIDRQDQQISHKLRLQSTLQGQIHQISATQEAVQVDTDRILELVAESQLRASKVRFDNEALKAKIRRIEEQTARIEARLNPSV